MNIGSYRDVLKWPSHLKRSLKMFKMPLVRKTLILLVLSWGIWCGVDWALRPGYWQGNLFGGGPTLLDTARHHFGPLLLVHTWIGDPPGYWGKLTLQQEGEMLRMWGQYESLARFKLIIALLWASICILVLLWKNRTAQPGRCSEPLPRWAIGRFG